MQFRCLRAAVGGAAAPPVQLKSWRRLNFKSRQTLLQASQAPDVRLIVSDVDGTLLNSKQQLTPRVEEAIVEAAKLGVPLVVATGKARGPWVPDVVPRLGSSMPGVFLQGCLIYDSDGHILYSKSLDTTVVSDCIQLSEELGVTLTAYCGERILCARTDEHTERLNFYREPPPEAVGSLRDELAVTPVAKLIFMAPQSRIDEIRPQLQRQLGDRAALTTALSGMLEILPKGVSKGAGVEWLLRKLGVPPENVMALGDGENDTELLQLAGWSCAMGNAGPALKAVADEVVASNDEDGVAQAINEFVLKRRKALA